MTETIHWDSGGIPVALPQIEKELNRFWRRQAQSEDRAVLRASTLTLIIITRSEEQYQSGLQAFPDLINHHPGRIIMVRQGVATAGGQVEGFISAHCQLAHPGGRQLCCEQITLLCPPEQEWTLHGILLPLLLPDLPVFLWWPEEPGVSLQPLQSLWSFIDRLIINSSRLQGTWQDFRRTCDALARLHGQVLVTDLGWSGVTNWREAIARCFDAPAGTAWLEGMERVRLTFSRPGQRAAGYWLLAWLATLLDWQPADAAVPVFSRSGRTIIIDQLVEEAAEEQGLWRVELFAQLDGQKRHYIITRQGQERLTIDDGEREIEWRSPVSPDGELMCRELDMAGGDELFQRICRFMV